MLLKLLYSIAIVCLISACGSIPSKPPEALPRGAQAAPPAPTPQQTEALLQAIIALDTDYRYGGRSLSSGFDCSGLVAHVFKTAWGVDLPHNARAQSDLGTPVEASALLPGDLVFYNTLNRPYSHVGIYLGEGKFIHAPKAGARVRIESLRTPYWLRRFDGARRLATPTERL